MRICPSFIKPGIKQVCKNVKQYRSSVFLFFLIWKIFFLEALYVCYHVMGLGVLYFNILTASNILNF